MQKFYQPYLKLSLSPYLYQKETTAVSHKDFLHQTVHRFHRLEIVKPPLLLTSQRFHGNQHKLPPAESFIEHAYYKISRCTRRTLKKKHWRKLKIFPNIMSFRDLRSKFWSHTKLTNLNMFVFVLKDVFST